MMKNIKLITVAIVLVAVTFFSFQLASENNSTLSNDTAVNLDSLGNDEEPAKIGEYTINSAISEGNLQVFLIDGTAELSTKKYTTLATAMEQKLVTVVETGTVNQLAIDNNSDEYVFIHSGDIVKGGQQDRTIAYDVIIPPNTKNVALQSFCVEHGRWSQRAGEDVNNFNSTNNMLSSRELKMAAKYESNQSNVWANVDSEQQKLNTSVSRKNGYSVDVKSGVSASSLQLTLESEELEKAKKDLEIVFRDLLRDSPNAIGYAYAINGEVYGVDVYNNRALFEEIWPKIVESIVIESISADNEQEFDQVKVGNVAAFMNAVGQSELTERSTKVNKSTQFDITENAAGDVVFSTIDTDEKQWLHKNYMKVIIDTSFQIQEINQFNGFNISPNQIRN